MKGKELRQWDSISLILFTDSISFLVPKVWEIVQNEIKTLLVLIALQNKTYMLQVGFYLSKYIYIYIYIYSGIQCLINLVLQIVYIYTAYICSIYTYISLTLSMIYLSNRSHTHTNTHTRTHTHTLTHTDIYK